MKLLVYFNFLPHTLHFYIKRTFCTLYFTFNQKPRPYISQQVAYIWLLILLHFASTLESGQKRITIKKYYVWFLKWGTWYRKRLFGSYTAFKLNNKPTTHFKSVQTIPGNINKLCGSVGRDRRFVFRCVERADPSLLKPPCRAEQAEFGCLQLLYWRVQPVCVLQGGCVFVCVNGRDIETDSNMETRSGASCKRVVVLNWGSPSSLLRTNTQLLCPAPTCPCEVYPKWRNTSAAGWWVSYERSLWHCCVTRVVSRTVPSIHCCLLSSSSCEANSCAV